MRPLKVLRQQQALQVRREWVVRQVEIAHEHTFACLCGQLSLSVVRLAPDTTGDR